MVNTHYVFSQKETYHIPKMPKVYVLNSADALKVYQMLIYLWKLKFLQAFRCWPDQSKLCRGQIAKPPCVETSTRTLIIRLNKLNVWIEKIKFSQRVLGSKYSANITEYTTSSLNSFDISQRWDEQTTPQTYLFIFSTNL